MPWVTTPVEGREPAVDLALPPVQLFWDQQLFGCVVLTQREWIDETMRLPFCQTQAKISLQTGSGLVALLGIFGEEFHGDSRKRLGDRSALTWRRRLACDVAVDPLQRIGRGKWQSAGRHLVHGDT